MKSAIKFLSSEVYLNPNKTPDDLSICPSDDLSSMNSELIARKRIQYGNNSDAAIGIFMEYCRNSTVHGVRYLGERKRPFLERAFWISFFLSSIYVCGYSTMTIWTKWCDSPVIVSFEERTRPLGEIPFPSIILCPETKAHAKVFNFSRIYSKLKADREALRSLNESELEYLEAFLHVCDADIVSNLNITALNTSKHILETIEELGPDMNSSSPFCRFNRIINWCEDILTPIFTDDGLCYQFNGLQTKYLLRNTSDASDNEINPDWSLENGYTDPLKTDVQPQRVFTAGESGSFFLITKGFQYDLEYLCRGSVPGFRIYLQSPDDVPQAPKQFIKVPFMEAIQITLIPNYISTSETLRKYEPERRQCYFSDERHLRFFKIYNQNNCNFECLINYTISECGCVKYTMPNPDDLRICGLADISCYTNAENGLLFKEFNEAIGFSRTNKYWKTDCHCLPSCTSLDYDFEISRAHYDIQNFLIAYRDDYLDENPGLLMSRVKISFKEQFFRAVKRSELYGTTNFLANCGGLFALFMGVSTLSLVELIYFCTVRLISNMKMRRRKQKSAFAAKIFGDGFMPGATFMKNEILKKNVFT